MSTSPARRCGCARHQTRVRREPPLLGWGPLSTGANHHLAGGTLAGYPAGRAPPRILRRARVCPQRSSGGCDLRAVGGGEGWGDICLQSRRRGGTLQGRRRVRPPRAPQLWPCPPPRLPTTTAARSLFRYRPSARLPSPFSTCSVAAVARPSPSLASLPPPLTLNHGALCSPGGASGRGGRGGGGGGRTAHTAAESHPRGTPLTTKGGHHRPRRALRGRPAPPMARAAQHGDGDEGLAKVGAPAARRAQWGAPPPRSGRARPVGGLDDPSLPGTQGAPGRRGGWYPPGEPPTVRVRARGMYASGGGGGTAAGGGGGRRTGKRDGQAWWWWRRRDGGGLPPQRRRRRASCGGSPSKGGLLGRRSCSSSRCAAALPPSPWPSPHSPSWRQRETCLLRALVPGSLAFALAGLHCSSNCCGEHQGGDM